MQAGPSSPARGTCNHIFFHGSTAVGSASAPTVLGVCESVDASRSSPLQPRAQDEEEPRIFPWSGEQAWYGRRADQALALRDLRHGQISGYCIEPSQAQACPK